MFKTFDSSYTLRVKLGNGEFVNAKGKGEAIVKTPASIKSISDVLYVLQIH